MTWYRIMEYIPKGESSYWAVMRDINGRALEFRSEDEVREAFDVVRLGIPGVRVKIEEAKQSAGPPRKKAPVIPEAIRKLLAAE
jgi:hypothetical protein